MQNNITGGISSSQTGLFLPRLVFILRAELWKVILRGKMVFNIWELFFKCTFLGLCFPLFVFVYRIFRWIDKSYLQFFF